jgi:hypothetical protein
MNLRKNRIALLQIVGSSKPVILHIISSVLVPELTVIV